MTETPFTIDPGLCRRCRWMRVVESSRGNQFTLCERSVVDASFRRYPVLPVFECHGFEPVDPDGSRSTSS